MPTPWVIFVITLTAGAALLGIELRCSGASDCPATLLQAFQEWQTLLGVTVALLAAGAAIWIVHWQTNESLRTARARRARVSRAFRAEMAEHLAMLEIYAKECVGVCARVIDEARSERNDNGHMTDLFASTQKRIPCPELPPRTAERLRQPVADLEPNLAVPIAELLGCYEAQRGRLQELVRTFNQPEHVADAVLEEHHAELPLSATIELYLRSTRLFPFARRQADLVDPLKVDYAEINIALIELGVSERLSPYGRERLLARFGVPGQCRRPPI